ncbi:hypothetical protein [Rhodopirellula baltica]|uniref:hypothetical protein n=1 Tax=Rhodopirellula baltica TaxID=265606 RepID=UPI001F2A954F|nr:hypothetical protein [Rhodopirellula baltica]
MTDNPYAPPTETETVRPVSHGANSEFRRGPAWYIIFSALAGAFASVPFLTHVPAIGLATLLIGCVVGGLIFRIRSRNWPHDPSVRSRQMLYSLIAISFPPMGLFLLAGHNAQGIGIILLGALVGAFIACGIFVSGTRRYSMQNERLKQADLNPIE